MGQATKKDGTKGANTKLVKKSGQVLRLPWSRDQINLIKRTVAKGSTDDELQWFLYISNRVGLDPLARQIYFTKFQTKTGEQMVIQTGIDGFRAIAERSGGYAGQDDVIYDDGKKYEKEPMNPEKATATIHRIVNGQKVSFTATARWSEYKPNPPKDFMWKKMPYLMLAKVAESLALRKAFPNDLSGLYTPEETQQSIAAEMPTKDKPEVIDAEPSKIDKPAEKKIVCEVKDCGKEVAEAVASFSKTRYDGKILCQVHQEEVLESKRAEKNKGKSK